MDNFDNIKLAFVFLEEEQSHQFSLCRKSIALMHWEVISGEFFPNSLPSYKGHKVLISFVIVIIWLVVILGNSDLDFCYVFQMAMSGSVFKHNFVLNILMIPNFNT